MRHLKKLGLTGLLIATLSGCSGNNSPKEGLIYAGNIHGNMVAYERISWDDSSVFLPGPFTADYQLTVKTPDGINLVFIDSDQDGRVDYFPENMDPKKARDLYSTVMVEINKSLNK